MKLLIDDMRTLDCDVIARNAEAAKEILKCNVWNEVYFDHDLGNGESGYDVMNFMFNKKIYPDKIYLITMNPVGKVNMQNLLKDYGYTCDDTSRGSIWTGQWVD